MHREVLIACAPYVAAIFASFGLLYLLVRFSGAKLQLAHVKKLNRDQQGGVQSLSFVLTLPVFVMILMFIVQLSQITIGTVVVEYAAFAAARAAMVWIPAETANEYANQIGVYRQPGSSSGSAPAGYAVYQVDSTGLKFQKIHFAAAMACMPICPSRATGASTNHPSMQAQASLQKAYKAMSPNTASNTKIPTRLTNKLAYALNNTHVYIEVHHPTRVDLGSDAPLARHPELDRFGYPVEFTDNEYGWQDQLYVTVTHDFALLPGPGRLLAKQAPATSPSSSGSSSSSLAVTGADRIADSLTKRGDVYTRTLTATVRLNNEGQKSSLPYYQTIYGQQPPNTAASDYAAANVKDESDSNDDATGADANGAGGNGANANGAGTSDDQCCGAGVGNNENNSNQAGQQNGNNQDGRNQEVEHQDGDNQQGEHHDGNNQNGNNQEGEHQDGNNQQGNDQNGDNRDGDVDAEGAQEENSNEN